ncbi:BnaAnng12390D [Brassica napus]|uniref:(rape) hypothetical protein n=1 Tax=Brassica napus TaxID=3708 RepID=A0A078IU61_BRANA|nr:unnamed protein product [Brassica napus]CDY53391.1 BnaAnng12390D [Brassica napus]
MTLHVRFSSISCFFALTFLVTTLVSLPSRRLDQVESLLSFKNEFTLSCNNSVTNSWNPTTHTQSSHASKTMHSLNSNNPLLLFSILVVFNFVLSFYIPLSTSL